MNGRQAITSSFGRIGHNLAPYTQNNAASASTGPTVASAPCAMFTYRSFIGDAAADRPGLHEPVRRDRAPHGSGEFALDR